MLVVVLLALIPVVAIPPAPLALIAPIGYETVRSAQRREVRAAGEH